jgi:hypothetical protein
MNRTDVTQAFIDGRGDARTLTETVGPRFGRDLRLRSYPEGTLAVAFTEVKSGRTVWHGAVSDALATNPEKADRETEKAVAKLLAKFPATKSG